MLKKLLFISVLLCIASFAIAQTLQIQGGTTGYDGNGNATLTISPQTVGAQPVMSNYSCAGGAYMKKFNSGTGQWYCSTPPGTGAGGVTTWNGRTGTVTPQSGDYSIGQVSGAATVASTGNYNDLNTKLTAAQIIASLQASFPGLTYMVSGPSASGAGLVPDTATQNTINALTTAGASTVLWRDTTGGTTNGTAALTGKGAGGGSGTLTVATAGGISNATVTLIGKGGAGSIGTLSISTNGGIVAVNLTGQGTGSGTGSLAVLAQHLAAFSLTGQGGAGGAGTVTAAGGSSSTNLVNSTTYDGGKFTFYTAGSSLSSTPSTLNGDGSYTIKSYNSAQSQLSQNGYAGLVTATTYSSPYTVSFNLNMSSSMFPSWQAAGDPEYVAWTFPGSTTLPTTSNPPPYTLAIGQRYASGVYYVRVLLHVGGSYYSLQADGSWSTTSYEFALSEAGCNVQIQCTANSPETYVITLNKLDGVTNIKTSATSPTVSGVTSDKIVLGDVMNVSGSSRSDYYYTNATFSNLTGF